MATFAQTSFNASIYSAGRPSYPGKFFKRILGYQKRSQGGPGFDLALDLGCGTGTLNAVTYTIYRATRMQQDKQHATSCRSAKSSR